MLYRFTETRVQSSGGERKLIARSRAKFWVYTSEVSRCIHLLSILFVIFKGRSAHGTPASA